MNYRLMSEANFGFRWMNINIDVCASYFEKQKGEWKSARRNDVVVRTGNGMQQQAISDQSMIDKGIDGISI